MSTSTEHNTPELFDLTEADTGPTDEELEQARRLIEIFSNLPTISEEEFQERHGSQTGKYVLGAEQHRDDYRPEGHDLPGFGGFGPDGQQDYAQPQCGVKIPHVCKGCGHSVEIGSTCRQSMCMRCAPKWVADRAVNVVARIMSAAKMKDGAQYKHHVVLSPPKEVLIDAEDPWDELMKVAKRWMKEIGMDGLAVPHPWSGAKDDEEFREEHMGNYDDDRGKWKERLFNEREWGEVRRELELRPHIHVIGAAPWVPGGEVTSLTYDYTGWIQHRITKRNGSAVSLGDFEDVARAVCYAISHSAIDTTGEQNRWLHTKIGSAYHNAGGRYHEQNVAEAREAVNKALSDLFKSVDSMDVECRAKVPEDEVDHECDHTVEDPDGATSKEPGYVMCRDQLVGVDDAEFVDEPAWQQRALFAQEAIEKREEWFEQGGWDALLEQRTLDDVDDDPPPD